MTSTPTEPSPTRTDTDTDGSTARARAAFARRTTPIAALSAEAPILAQACRAMARRFGEGGRLVAFGTGTAAADAAHVAVEFVHPVIVGKRALPALALPGGPSGFAAELELLAGPRDIAVAFAPDAERAAAVAPVLAGARRRGLLTVALLGADRASCTADHVIAVASADPRIVREGHVTAYHVLWELVHVFLEAGADRRVLEAGPDPDPEPGEVCITCSDQALPFVVLALRDDGLALVDTGGGRSEEVSVALVDAAVGDTVLVHAGEAIAVVAP